LRKARKAASKSRGFLAIGSRGIILKDIEKLKELIKAS
jgi:hypothetical protein